MKWSQLVEAGTDRTRPRRIARVIATYIGSKRLSLHLEDKRSVAVTVGPFVSVGQLQDKAGRVDKMYHLPLGLGERGPANLLIE